MATIFSNGYPIVPWDIARNLPAFVPFGKDGETGRGFKIKLMQNQGVISPSTETMRFYAEKPDKTHVYIDAVIDGDTFRFDLTTQVFTVVGNVVAHLELNSGGEKIFSNNFTIVVDSNLLDGSIESSNEFTALATALEDVKKGELFASVKNFGAVGDGVTDDTNAFQSALTACYATRTKVFIPRGDYLITDTLKRYSGSQIEGINEFQYNNGFDKDPKGSTIIFSPLTLKSLFEIEPSINQGGFNFHMSMKNLFLKCTQNGKYGLDQDHVIFGKFENMAIQGFQYPIYNNGTINNRNVNLYLSGTIASILYAGNNETTDVWEQCSLYASPKGVVGLGSTIDIRFNNCLFEQIGTQGADLAKETQNMTFDNCYAEDVPFTEGDGHAMFKVGHTGVNLVDNNNITIIGGMYNGRNTGNVGAFLDGDYMAGATIISPVVNRYTDVFKATANTKDHAITVEGCRGIGRTNFISGSLDKIKGNYHAANNNETPRIDSNLGIVRMLDLILKNPSGVEYKVAVNAEGQVVATLA